MLLDRHDGVFRELAEARSVDGRTWTPPHLVFASDGSARDAAGIASPRIVAEGHRYVFFTAIDGYDGALPDLPARSLSVAYATSDGVVFDQEVLRSASSCASPGIRQWNLVDVVRPVCARCRTDLRWLLVVARPCPGFGGDETPRLELHAFGDQTVPPVELGPVTGTPTTALFDDRGLWVYAVDEGGALTVEHHAVDVPPVTCEPF